MLSFFPEPYPDELLYSVLARYHIRHGNIAAKATLRELFGNQKITAIYDLPCGMDRLVRNLPLNNKHTTEGLIENNTLYPYYAAFLPTERAKQIKASMKSDFGGDIHSRCGIMASSISPSEYFRFCPLCNQEDLKEYGEIYWHRLHQIQGIQVCSKHGAYLQNSTIKTHNKHDFIGADTDNCYCNSTGFNQSFNLKDFRLHYEFTQEVIWFLNNYQEIPSPEVIQECYLSILKKEGLATPQGRVFQDELHNRFINYYGHSYLKQLQSDIDVYEADNWLSCIVRKHRKAFHPIRHILMIKFLSNSLKDFLRNEICYEPFGKGPWLCMNAAAEHYKSNVVTDLKISYCADTKLPVGTFRCSCGFIYSRRGPDKYEEDKYRIGRIKAYGPVWENKLREYAEQKVSQGMIARLLKADPNTIKKYIDLLHTEYQSNKTDDENNQNSHIENNVLIKERYRKEWMNIVINNPEKTKTQLRSMATSIYTWLYRNDRDWLNEIPYLSKKHGNNPDRIDWGNRDKELLSMVEKAANELLLCDSKPIRITISRIGNMINYRTLLERHLDKLPDTKNYLRQNIESIEEFQRRRVVWATRSLINSDQLIMKWKIIRMAGLKNKNLPGIDSIIQNELNCNQLTTLYTEDEN